MGYHLPPAHTSSTGSSLPIFPNCQPFLGTGKLFLRFPYPLLLQSGDQPQFKSPQITYSDMEVTPALAYIQMNAL